jgi:hypothetical protein
MNSQILDRVVTRLKADGPSSWPALAKLSGVPLSTIQKVAHGHSRNPRVRTVEALAGAIDDKDLSGAP